jgi:hypothetical protein
MMSDLEPDKLGRGLSQTLLRPSAQRYSKSATATIPINSQHGDDQITTAGGWAILSAHRQARRHAVGF